MDKIIITIKTGNAAFEAFEGLEHYEVARILRRLADKLENGSKPERLLDINGNNVGTVEYE